LDRHMRNTKKAMIWLQGKPSFDEIVEKIASIEKHIENCGSNHPSHKDFKGALFLLQQEESKMRKSDKHLQRGFNFGDMDISPLGSNEVAEVKQYATKAERDAVFQALRKQMNSLDRPVQK